MSTARLDDWLKSLSGVEPALAIFWLGLAAFTVGVAVLLYTRVGQYRPLRKCMILSLLAHLILVCYAATVQIVMPGREPASTVVHLAVGDDAAEKGIGGSATVSNSKDQPPKDQPWEVLPGDTAVGAELTAWGTSEGDSPIFVERKSGQSPTRLDAEPRRFARANDMPPALLRQFDRLPSRTADGSDEPLGIPSLEESASFRAAARAPMPACVMDRVAADATDAASDAANAANAANATRSEGLSQFSSDENGTVPLHRAAGRAAAVPEVYRLRVAPHRADVAQSHGGSAETEAAVKAALKWLADNQAADGRWDPKSHGGGNETSALGRDRGGAGGAADTGLTGLALLAFLASGHTHVEGGYRETVRRGLEYLIETQASDGNLAGRAATFEFMYCHAMATCALSEDYGMTRDDRLREPVRKAVGYTLRAQDPIGGGWRYKPGDAGDTSQLGWQVMALESAELAGFPIPEKTRQGIIRYLQSVSSGQYGGRASYRPNESPSRSMTAESLFCWQLLGLPRQHPAGNEAAGYLLEEKPGEGVFNLYYWYYATLSMYQWQDAHWRQWNGAMRAAVLSHQVKDAGPLAGSWDTNDLWGGGGGRVFTTALASLTLEVYYRFLPLYVEVAAENDGPVLR